MWILEAVLVAAGVFMWLRFLWYLVLVSLWWFTPSEALDAVRRERRDRVKAIVHEAWPQWGTARILVWTAGRFALWR
jgi:hypothetical protein